MRARFRHTVLTHAVPCLTFVAWTAFAAPAAAQGADPPKEPPAATDPAPTTSAPPETPPVTAPPLVTPETPAPTGPLGAPGYNEPIRGLPTSPDAQDHARVDNSPSAHDGKPLAGYHNGLFFLRDHHDNFHLYIQGRAQIDFYSYLGAGVPETPLKPTLFLRRIRPEVTGEFLGHWRFMLAGDFGATALDNPNGTNELAAARPGVAPTINTARFAAADATRFQAAPTDVFLNYRAKSWFNTMVGQMDAPFMMENRTSDKYIPFMERSLAVRAIGVPTNKEIGGMFWGETEDRLFYYSAGLYAGDGQNRPNVDARGDVMMRTFVHPFARDKEMGALSDSQIGMSFRYGSRDHKWVNYDYPQMTTQGAYAFWRPQYNGANGTPNHIIPSGDQIGVAGELRIPFERFDLTSEFVYVHNNTREAPDGLEATRNDRYGDIRGAAYYVQVGWWPCGNRDINGTPGYGNPPRLDWSRTDPVVPLTAFQVLAKWEQVALTYRSASRAGTPDGKNIDGDIALNAFSLGFNYWATRHVRITANYVVNMFPGSAGGAKQTADNRAVAPGNTLDAGVNDSAREGAHTLHEILMRFAIAL